MQNGTYFAQTPVFEPGRLAPPGIYVVTHRKPAHVVPHELAIVRATALPKCNACEGVHFSRKSDLPPVLEQSEFFGNSAGAAELQSIAAAQMDSGLQLCPAAWGESRRAAENFLEVSLAYITTLIEISKDRDRRGDYRGGDRNRTQARCSINSLRRLIWRNPLLGGVFRGPSKPAL